MKIDANSIRVGDILEYKKNLWLVLKRAHTQPGKGGAFIQVELKDIINGTKLNERFRSSETLDKARLEEEEYQYLYPEGDGVALMNNETFEQISLNKEVFSDNFLLLQEGMNVKVQFHNNSPISAKLPESIVVEIHECEPVMKGQTVTSSFKPAIIHNGVRVMVPPFVSSGDKILLRTEDMQYLERVK